MLDRVEFGPADQAPVIERRFLRLASSIRLGSTSSGSTVLDRRVGEGPASHLERLALVGEHAQFVRAAAGLSMRVPEDFGLAVLRLINLVAPGKPLHSPPVSAGARAIDRRAHGNEVFVYRECLVVGNQFKQRFHLFRRAAFRLTLHLVERM